MADENVSLAQFGEFVKRIDERFDHVNERFDHVNERFDHVNERFERMQKDMASGFAQVRELADQRYDNLTKLGDQRYDNMMQLADQRYDSINQRFADADKAREQNLVHVNQRFDSLEKRFDDLRTLMVVMYTPLAIALLGALVKWFFFT